MDRDLKERIIKKASELFVLNGIRAVTMDYIASQMGISKRTLYEQFNDKDTLLLEVLKDTENRKLRESEEIAASCNNSLEIFLKVYRKFLQELRRTNRNYFRDLKRYHPNVASFFEARKAESIRNNIQLTEKGIAEGLIRPELNPEILSLLLQAQFEILVCSDIIDTNRFTFTEVFETIVMNYARGIVTSKGMKLIEEFENTWK